VSGVAIVVPTFIPRLAATTTVRVMEVDAAVLA
jgi:hypothetical protein